MADGIYVSMAGATARERQLDAIADNLANANTPGFKASRPVFATVLAEQGGLRAFPTAVSTGADLRPGATAQTGNQLDVLPEGGAFLGVRTSKGTLAFTRDGRLSVDGQGTLRAAGLPVLGSTGETVSLPPNSKLEIGQRGELVVDGNQLGRLALFHLEGDADRSGPSLVTPTAKGRATQVDGKVATGAVEQGNSTPLDAMIDMVSAQRHFDASMQALDAYRKMGDRSNELGKVR